MIGPVVCSQWPSCHQFVTRQPQSSHQSNRHTRQSTEQMSRCLNQFRQASHPPLIKLASHLSRSGRWPHWGKRNDGRFTHLVADGPRRLELELPFSAFPPKPNEFMHRWNINSASPLLTCDHFQVNILFVGVFLSLDSCFLILQHTPASHERWNEGGGTGSFPTHNIERIEKNPSLICLRCGGTLRK